MVLKYLEELASTLDRQNVFLVVYNLPPHNTTRLDVGHKILLKDSQDKSALNHTTTSSSRKGPHKTDSWDQQDGRCTVPADWNKMAAVQSQNQFGH